jgi:predicted MFS family arabinose efflux permease
LKTSVGAKPAFLVLVALWLMVLASSSQVMIIPALLPRIQELFHVPEALQGVLIASYAVSMGVFGLLIGPVSDRVGRRIILLWGTGLLTVALAIHSLAWDFSVLLAVRVLAGVAGGVLTGAAVAYVGDFFPYERRGWANGWVMSGFAIGQVIAVPTGIVMAERYGFRAPFLLFAAIAGAAFALVLVALPQPPVVRSLTSLSVRSMLHAYASLLHRSSVVGAATGYGFLFFALSTMIAFFPTWAETKVHMMPAQVAGLLAFGGIAHVVFGPLAGRWSDRVGRKPLVVGSCLASAVLFAAMPAVAFSPALVGIGYFMTMALFALRLSPLQALLTSLVPEHRRGALLSLVVASGHLGGSLGGALAGITYGYFGYGGNAALAAVAIAVTGFLVWSQLPEPPTNQTVISSDTLLPASRSR